MSSVQFSQVIQAFSRIVLAVLAIVLAAATSWPPKSGAIAPSCATVHYKAESPSAACSTIKPRIETDMASASGQGAKRLVEVARPSMSASRCNLDEAI